MLVLLSGEAELVCLHFTFQQSCYSSSPWSLAPLVSSQPVKACVTHLSMQHVKYNGDGGIRH